MVFLIDSLSDEMLQKAFEYCLTEEARAKVRECRDRATKATEQVRDEFISALDLPNSSSARVLSEKALNKYKYFSNRWSKRWEQPIVLRYQVTDSIKWLFKQFFRA